MVCAGIFKVRRYLVGLVGFILWSLSVPCAFYGRSSGRCIKMKTLKLAYTSALSPEQDTSGRKEHKRSLVRRSRTNFCSWKAYSRMKEVI